MLVQARGEPTGGSDPVREFYTHLTIYVMVNGSLLALNLLAGGPAWAVWPLLGWGLGLIVHRLNVFLRIPNGPRGGKAGL